MSNPFGSDDGDDFIVLGADAPSYQVSDALKDNTEYVAIEDQSGTSHLYSALALRLRAARAGKKVQAHELARDAERYPLFALDTLPSEEQDWWSLYTELQGVHAPGVVIGIGTRGARFLSALEIRARAGFPGGFARPRSAAFAAGRRYVCHQCSPPTYARPGYGGDPVCPADPSHGTMTEG